MHDWESRDDELGLLGLGVGRRASGVGRRASGVGRRASGGVGRRRASSGVVGRRRASGVGRRASGVGRRASGVGRRASGVGRRASSCVVFRASHVSRVVRRVRRRRRRAKSSSCVVVLRRASYVDSIKRYGQFSLIWVHLTSEYSSPKIIRKFLVLGSPKFRSPNFRKICFIIFLNFQKFYTPKISRKFMLVAYIINFFLGASDIYV